MNIHLADSLEEFDLRYIESCNQCFSSGYNDNNGDDDSYDQEEANDISEPLNSRFNSIASKTNKLTLSSPLLDNSELFSGRKQDPRIPIYDDKKLKLVNASKLNGTGTKSEGGNVNGDGVNAGSTSSLSSNTTATTVTIGGANNSAAPASASAAAAAHTVASAHAPAPSLKVSTTKSDPLKNLNYMKDFKRPPLKPSLTSGSIGYKKNSRNNLGNPFYKPPSFESSNSVLTINDLESPSKKRKVSLNNSVSSFESLLSLHNKQQEFTNEFLNEDPSLPSQNQSKIPPQLVNHLPRSSVPQSSSKDGFISSNPTSESSFNDTDDDNDPAFNNDSAYNYYNENNDIYQ